MSDILTPTGNLLPVSRSSPVIKFCYRGMIVNENSKKFLKNLGFVEGVSPGKLIMKKQFGENWIVVSEDQGNFLIGIYPDDEDNSIHIDFSVSSEFPEDSMLPDVVEAAIKIVEKSLKNTKELKCPKCSSTCRDTFCLVCNHKF